MEKHSPSLADRPPTRFSCLPLKWSLSRSLPVRNQNLIVSPRKRTNHNTWQHPQHQGHTKLLVGKALSHLILFAFCLFLLFSSFLFQFLLQNIKNIQTVSGTQQWLATYSLQQSSVYSQPPLVVCHYSHTWYSFSCAANRSSSSFFAFSAARCSSSGSRSNADMIALGMCPRLEKWTIANVTEMTAIEANQENTTRQPPFSSQQGWKRSRGGTALGPASFK